MPYKEPVLETSIQSIDRFLNLDQLKLTSTETNPFFENQIVPTVLNDNITEIVNALIDDVGFSKDRLVALNSGRVHLIEKRIDSIARKIALIGGEKYQSTVVLEEVIRNSFKSTKRSYPVQLAWRAFIAEVSLYNLFEIFILKSLDFYGIRVFDPSDVRKMNFSIHSFLSQKAVGFNHDKHCWNFVRNNIYSWYTPGSETSLKVNTILEKIDQTSPLSWSDIDLLNWIKVAPESLHLSHLQFYQGHENAKQVLDLIENGFQIPISRSFRNQNLFSKVFIPSLGRSGLALGLLEKFLNRLTGNLTSPDEEQTLEAQQIQNALWLCESEALELYWTEIMSLLKVLKLASSDRAISHSMDKPNFKIPQVIHSVHALGLELHNLEQLPLSGAELSRLHQGSAGKIQQLEMFDLSIVADCPERNKSQTWMQAMADQIPFWRQYIGTNTNINWGECHLLMGVSKLKDSGRCVYLSSKQLTDIKDGEKLRKTILSECYLERFLEIRNQSVNGFQYVYVFRKCMQKEKRDSARTEFATCDQMGNLEFKNFEKTYFLHGELVEKGFLHLFSKHENSILRQFENHYPKLFQLAHIYAFCKPKTDDAVELGLSIPKVKKDQIYVNLKNDKYNFSHLESATTCFIIIPHNPNDISWMLNYLNSGLIEKWITASRSLQTSKQFKLHDLKHLPMLDVNAITPDLIARYSEFLGSIQSQDSKDCDEKLNHFINDKVKSSDELLSLFIAISNRKRSLETLFDRYRPFFISDSIENGDLLPKIKPQSITHFYPERLLVSLQNSSEVKIQYIHKEQSHVPTELWFIKSMEMQSSSKKQSILIQTTLNTQILLSAPIGTAEYILDQLELLKEHPWVECLHLVKVPSDVSLFISQTQEISRIISHTAENIRFLHNHSQGILLKTCP